MTNVYRWIFLPAQTLDLRSLNLLNCEISHPVKVQVHTPEFIYTCIGRSICDRSRMSALLVRLGYWLHWPAARESLIYNESIRSSSRSKTADLYSVVRQRHDASSLSPISLSSECLLLRLATVKLDHGEALQIYYPRENTGTRRIFVGRMSLAVSPVFTRFKSLPRSPRKKLRNSKQKKRYK